MGGVSTLVTVSRSGLKPGTMALGGLVHYQAGELTGSNTKETASSRIPGVPGNHKMTTLQTIRCCIRGLGVLVHAGTLEYQKKSPSGHPL